MNEVHRYKVVTMLSMAGATIGYDPHGPDVVMASDFDNAARLFLDAAERCVAAERREKELQQRLTAADERADVLEGLLRMSLVAMRRIYLAGEDRIIELGADCDSVDAMMESDPAAREIRAALKPADGGGDE